MFEMSTLAIVSGFAQGLAHNLAMHPKVLLQACADLVDELLTFEHPADAVISKFFRDRRKGHSLGPRERGIAAETAYAVLRFKLRYEFMARSGVGPRERRLAILGFAHGSGGNRGFLNGALDPVEKNWLEACEKVHDSQLMAAHRHNMPPWLAERLEAEIADTGLPSDQVKAQFWALVSSLNAPATLDLRVNALKEKRQTVLAQWPWPAIKIEETPHSPLGLRVAGKPALGQWPAFAEGWVEVQDEGSQLLALLVDAKRGEMVCDFCAGAGGKTLALGAAMRNTGRLYAFDVSGHRLEALKPRLARSGLSNVHPAMIAHERDERVKRLSGKMDRVLVDAPCSGLGTLRRNPDLKWRQSEASVIELQAKQAAILASAARMVKPGGRLVYATCSLLRSENEGVAQTFSVDFPDFEKVDVADILRENKVAAAADLTRNGYLRLWPHAHQTDGFFAAVWQKKSL